MSLTMIPNASRLTVLGSGWNNSSIESGDGLTESGKQWEDIAGDLGYDYGSSMDWDNVSSDYGITDDGNGNWVVPKDVMLDISAILGNISTKDSELRKYSVNSNDIKNLYGGPVSSETEWPEGSEKRPHTYSPPVYYIQKGKNDAYLFYGEPFYHYTADGEQLLVNDKSIELRDGSSMKVYWSQCSTNFTDQHLPDPYNSYPIEYVCWQCLYGSFGGVTIAATNKTISTESIKNGTSGLPTTTIKGKEYFLISQRA